MSATITMEIEARDFSKNPRQLRSEGIIPATVYGKGVESESIQLNGKNFIALYKANRDATFELKGSDKSFKTVVQNVQTRATTDSVLSVEFKNV